MNVEVGMIVDINPRSDRTRKFIVRGPVSSILSKNQNHPHGVLVKLETGEIGRVKNILGTSKSTPRKNTAKHSSPKDHEVELKALLEEGENHWIEFKSDILWSANLSGDDIKNHRPQSKELHEYGKATSKIIIAKTIAAFLNSDGGTLIVGIRENKETGIDEIIGVECEFKKLKDGTQDGYRRMIVDLVKDYFPSSIFNHLNEYMLVSFEEVASKKICGIRVKRSDKRVFLKLNKRDHFFIRTDASTRELHGEEIVDYCQNRFV